MYFKDGAVVIRKGFMEWSAFEAALAEARKGIDETGTPMALHFRIATHGGVKPQTCHPFAVTSKLAKMGDGHIEARAGFMHNGTLTGLETKKGLSDTMAFVANVLYPLRAMGGRIAGNRNAESIVSSTTQGSRFLLFEAPDCASMFGDWAEDGGVFYSNDSYRRVRYGLPSKPDDETGMFGCFGEPQDGLFDSCFGCPYEEECTMFGAMCETSRLADSVSSFF